jgi:hypothetical protein
MITEGNKTKVEKAGLDDEIRDGYEYEMTISLEIINDKHLAKASKDRTQLFAGKPEFIITTETGKQILNWCNEGIDFPSPSRFPIPSANLSLDDKISACKTVDELLLLFKAQTPLAQQQYAAVFTKKRQQLTVSIPD